MNFVAVQASNKMKNAVLPSLSSKILHWYHNHPNRNSFHLEEVFWGIKGTAAELDIPKAIKFTDILDT